MPSLALIGHLIDSVDAGGGGPIARAAVHRAAGWCEYLEGHARRLHATVTDPPRVAAALLATKITVGHAIGLRQFALHGPEPTGWWIRDSDLFGTINRDGGNLRLP